MIRGFDVGFVRMVVRRGTFRFIDNRLVGLIFENKLARFCRLEKVTANKALMDELLGNTLLADTGPMLVSFYLRNQGTKHTI
jgi:hypothetical protein